MNIINKGLVALVMSPKFLYKKSGVDTDVLALILKTKLLIDDRRPNTLHLTRPQKSGKQVSLATVGTMVFSAFLGAIFLISFKIGVNLVTQVTIYFSFYIFMLTLTLITDFTSVLIDVRDNQIILPKPVSDKTFVLSRLLHIFIHINKIILPMSLPGLIFIGFKYGLWQSFTLLFSVFMVTIFCIFIINTVYLLILQVTTPQKFKTIISYVQIGMTVGIYGISQILPRMADMERITTLDIASKSGRWFVPPYWFARGWNFFSSFQFNRENIIGAILLILVPVVSIYVVIKFLAPSFTRKLAMMAGGSETTDSQPVQLKTKRPGFWSTISERLSKMFTSSPEEKMAFQLVWKLTGRSRDFKLKVYPGAGYLLVILTIMLYNHYSKTGSAFAITSSPAIVLGLSYASGLLLLTSINQLQYSESYKASWFYLITPLQKPGHLFSGAIKAAAAKFLLPLALLISIFQIGMFGWKVIPNFLLGFSNVMLTCYLISLVTFRNLPFSAPQSSGKQTGMMLRTFACSILAGIVGLLHYLVFSFLPVVCILLVLSLIANWLLVGSLKNKSWAVIRSSYEE